MPQGAVMNLFKLKEKTIKKALYISLICSFLLWTNGYADGAEHKYKKHYLMRHGQVEANAKKLVCARECYDPLTDEGVSQIRKTAQYIKENNIEISHIVHSGLPRTRETAEIINDDAFDGALKISIDSRLQEIGIGNLEKNTKTRVNWCRDSDIAPLLQYVRICPRNVGEPLDMFMARVVNALNDYSNIPDNNVLYVTHGYVIKGIIGNGKPALAKKIKNGELLILKYPKNSAYREASKSGEVAIKRVYAPPTSSG
jgi:broad specificity phosphatase PhoE